MGLGSLAGKQDRRERLIGLLRSDDIWTTHKLAAELEISHRTLMRDLDELKVAGYPLEAERGRGGGVRLAGRWGVEKLTLSNQDVMSLLVSLALTESLRPSLIATNAKSIRQEIANTFPEPQRKTINQLRARILIGKPASPHVIATPRPCSCKLYQPHFLNPKNSPFNTDQKNGKQHPEPLNRNTCF